MFVPCDDFRRIGRKSMLEYIESPADLRKLTPEQLKPLCKELRDYIIECCSTNPGHLGSSLGAVELIVGLHYVFDTPHDKIVFDVGHQAYAHKILTGRREQFKKNRMAGGLSGFPKRSESEYDVFGAGHSSTSISAALGLSCAAKLKGTDEKIIAFIGDGALTGGLALEGLNNAGASKSDLLIILNDNNCSIDKNIGGLHDYLLRLTTDPTYNKIKNKIWNQMGEGWLRDRMQNIVRSTKSTLSGNFGGALFEALGFRYFGPVDGNDMDAVIDALSRLKDIKGPRILHTITKKGKGYAPAENNPTVWHAPGKFDPITGQRLSGGYKADRYQDVFGQVLLDLARNDKNVIGVTPAMATGCGMNLLAEELPSQFFDVGIEEEHAVTFSAGLATGGMRPFCNIYSSFSQRAYDEIIHDVALQNLPVVLCFDRAGLVGEDGATHHGCYDIAAYRSIPNAVIAVPRNELELKNMMFTALHYPGGPYIIRYPRGCGEGVEWKTAPYEQMTVGKSEKLVSGASLTIIAAGPESCRAVEAADIVYAKSGIRPKVYDVRFVKPLDRSMMEDAAGTGKILTVEEGCLKGGLFGAVTEYLAENAHFGVQVAGLGIPDEYISQDTQSNQRHSCGLDAESIAEKVLLMIDER